MTILFSLAILPLIWCLKQAAEKSVLRKAVPAMVPGNRFKIPKKKHKSNPLIPLFFY
jgi:hypothetical protein